MAFEYHNYDLVTVLAAESIGVPGQRRFRVIGGVGTDVVSLWMEKEQLNALGQAIGQLLEQLTESGLVKSTIQSAPVDVPGPLPPGSPEYLVSKIMIGYDEERKLVAVFAHDIEQEDDDQPIFSGRATLEMALGLSEQIETVIASGRPRCPRCGAPIGPEGHVCPHNNGHLPWTGNLN
ncbi:MAG TPA: DUF3090 family protein [Nitrolancea sp.]|nr:DUF3090 family protein [Nitrolancea sp.]